jgi:hypothetical protein
MVEYFKGDDNEVKVYEAAKTILDSISFAFDEYYAGVYESGPLGEFLYDEDRVPLTNAVKRDIFITSFVEIFNAWTVCGTFESYITVFKKIFGDDATIEFTVPAAGKLTINITSSGFVTSPLIARRIVSNAYVFDNLVDENGDNVCASTILGIENEYELQKILFTMVPAGIFTTVSLTIGS